MSRIFVSQEMLDDAGGYEVPGEFLRQLLAIQAFHIEHPGVERDIAVARPGWRAWWHRLVCRLRRTDDQDLRGWEFHETPEWAAFLKEFPALPSPAESWAG